jgi:hypothetical protein
MEYIEQKLGRDLFGLVLEFFDPIKDKQIERKLVIHCMFKRLWYHAYQMPSDRYSRCSWIIQLRQYDNNRKLTEHQQLLRFFRKNMGIDRHYIADIYKVYGEWVS